MKAKIVTLGIVGLMMLAGLGTLDAEARGPPFAVPRERPTDNLVEVAIAVNSAGPYTGMFDTIIAAVVYTGLNVPLSNESYQFTVFAPTDAAFEAIGLNETNIVTLPVPLVTEILLYHVTDGRLYSIPIVHKKQIEMLNEQMLYVDGTVLTDQNDRTANIFVTDVEASNGVIHVIDAVVLPYIPE